MPSRRYLRILRAGSIGAAALQVALIADAALAQVNLPTLDVGATKPVRHHAAPAKPQTTHVAAAPAHVAAPARTTRPAPSRPAPRAEEQPQQPQQPSEVQAWQQAAPGTQQPTYPDFNKPLTQPQGGNTASSVRDFSPQQVNARVFAQPQEALEIDPGLVIAQHSGSGKAAQYFLRGFALDHGYDIGITFDGMNVNHPTQPFSITLDHA